MVNTEGRLSDVPSDKIKGRIRKKHKTDVIKIIEPEDCVVAPNIPNHTDGCSTQEFIHQPFEFEASTQPREKLTLSPSKVPDEIFKKRVKKKKIDSETKMSSNHKKRGRGAGPKRKLSLSSESEVEGTDSTEGRMRRKSAPLKTPTMVTCNACLKEMTQTEYRRHNRLPHEQECTVPGCTLRFSDKADLQHHRRTAHFLANSNRKSWVSSAMDQCHKKLFAHLLLEHDISEGDQMFTASQEDLTEQIKLSDEVLVIPKVEIKQDQIQVKLEKEKPENDSKEELQMSEKKRRRSSKKEHDPITEGLFKVEEDFKPMLNQPIKNNDFYAQLKEEGIKECPTCLFYFEENVFEKHFKKDHNIPCRKS